MMKIINDPVHGFIQVSSPLIQNCINHTYFQRLRRISQLGLTQCVYPGATHSRLIHALGSYHLMDSAVRLLKRKGVKISQDEEEAVKIAILFHDLGHGPFSHSLEYLLFSESHEELSIRMMHEINREFEGKLDMAIQIFQNQYEKKFLHQLVSSQLDMDRLDYLKRDSYYTGVVEGSIGVSRILAMLDVDGNNLVVQEKGILSILNYVQSRSLMYWQVYLHKTVLSAENMLVNIIKRLKELSSKNQFHVEILPNTLKKVFNMDANLSIDEFSQIDESDIYVLLKTLLHHDDIVLRTLSSGVLNRSFYKTVDKIPEGYMKEIEINFPKDVIPYFTFSKEISKENYSSEQPIYIKSKNGQISEFEELAIKKGIIASHLPKLQKKTFTFYYPLNKIV